MKQMEEYKSMLARLNSLIGALEKGDLSIDELVEMEEVTRKLHERSIILRYNAFKDRVSSQSNVIAEESVGLKAEEAPVEEEVVEEEQAFDFSIFSEPEEDIKPVPEPIIEIQPEPEPVAAVEEAPEVTIEIEADEEEIEEVVPEPEVEPEMKVEETEETVSVPSGGSSFLERLVIPDNSLGTRFAAAKLDSLIGAFGLNERLRFINDLFEGSSELFSEAIKSLDTQNDLSTARNTAATLAEKYEWDPEEEVVVEFMTYISRRYA